MTVKNSNPFSLRSTGAYFSVLVPWKAPVVGRRQFQQLGAELTIPVSCLWPCHGAQQHALTRDRAPLGGGRLVDCHMGSACSPMSTFSSEKRNETSAKSLIFL